MQCANMRVWTSTTRCAANTDTSHRHSEARGEKTEFIERQLENLQRENSLLTFGLSEIDRFVEIHGRVIRAPIWSRTSEGIERKSCSICPAMSTVTRKTSSADATWPALNRFKTRSMLVCRTSVREAWRLMIEKSLLQNSEIVAVAK